MRPRNALFRFAAIAVAAAGFALVSPLAHADIEHTVQRGHTLEAISNRYHVTKKLIIDANHLKPGQHLRIGEVLIIPGVGNDRLSAREKAKLGKDGKGSTLSYAMRPRTPGVVKLTRIALKEDYTVRVADRRGKQPPNAAKEFEKLMRSPNGGATHEIDSRLIALVGIMSNHFGGRKVEVVSGFRPYTPTQYTAHSNHNHGRAIDFRIAGVPNEVVRDFCRTLHNTGCGYYPNSIFVHMDVRDKPVYWIDYSRPGEAPRYNSPNAEADESAGDVHRENPGENAPPPGDVPPQSPTDTPAPPAGTDAPSAPPASMTTPSTAPITPAPSAPNGAPQTAAPQATAPQAPAAPPPQMPERITAPAVPGL